MQITEHVYSTHILEDQATFGAMHPGGTQIYFVGDLQDGMVVVDSGEPYRAWTRQILDYHAELGQPPISAILVTHGHGDHIGGLDRLQEVFACPVRCHPKLAPALVQRLGADCVFPLRSRELVWTAEHNFSPSPPAPLPESEGGESFLSPTGRGAGGEGTNRGVSLRALFTPGHEDDHVCYYLRADGVLFSGDNILGNSSSSVRNLKQYMTSLELMARQRPRIICPGHGQVIRGGEARIRWQLSHRQEREDQVLAALAGGAATVDDTVNAVYPRNLRKNLRPAAARNVTTHLAKLREEHRVAETPASYQLAHE